MKPKTKTTTKKKTPAIRALLLKMDSNAQKALEIVRKNTGEKTDTKAIIQALHQSDHYMKEFKKEKDRANALEDELQAFREGLSSYTMALRELNELADPKRKPKPIKKEECDVCGKLTNVKDLDRFGCCPECA